MMPRNWRSMLRLNTFMQWDSKLIGRWFSSPRATLLFPDRDCGALLPVSRRLFSRRTAWRTQSATQLNSSILTSIAPPRIPKAFEDDNVNSAFGPWTVVVNYLETVTNVFPFSLSVLGNSNFRASRRTYWNLCDYEIYVLLRNYRTTWAHEFRKCTTNLWWVSMSLFWIPNTIW